ncbi:MAG TPA: DUF998 domain-containing protein [Nitrososphaerales archaeon]|nr:DUF998 domain-containing protein [Nitrososphaerales archaeon]
MQLPDSESAKNKLEHFATDTNVGMKIAGILFVFGGLLFILLSTASESLYPSFSLLDNSFSDMAAVGTRTFPVEETAVFGVAITWIAGAYFLYRGTGRKIFSIFNAIAGTGSLLAGLSPENLNLTIHSVGALLLFPFGAAAVFLSYRVIHSSFRYFSIGLGSLTAAATLVTFFGENIVGPCGNCVGKTPGYVQSLTQLGLGLGGWEAMIIFPLLIWLIGFGSYLMATSSSTRRTGQT